MSGTAPHPTRMLVTGGRGRLAALVAGHFQAPAHEVQLFSRAAGAGYLGLDEMPDSLPGADVLLHLAWSTLPATSETADRQEWRTDLPRLEKILRDIATQPGARRPHFVFFSSGGAVYGNAPGRPSLETDPTRPLGSYGRAKCEAEEMIAGLSGQLGLDCAILRIANPYGYPVPADRAQGVIPHAIRCAFEDKPLTLWGDGLARKDFLYYTDFLAALDEIVRRRLTGLYNICAGESHSVHEIISLVEKHTGRMISTSRIAAPPWDVQDSRLDHGRFTAATGWRPRVDLDEGIRRATANYLAARS